MKSKLFYLFAFCVFANTATAQTAVPVTPIDATPIEATPDETDVPMLTTFASDDVSTQHERTLAIVKEKIQNSPKLGKFQKRRLLRRLNRPAVAVRVTDEITSRAMNAGLVRATYVDAQSDEDPPGGSVEITVDWDELINFIEKLIPLIVQLIGLFG